MNNFLEYDSKIYKDNMLGTTKLEKRVEDIKKNLDVLY
jgi:hypothetical protein